MAAEALNIGFTTDHIVADVHLAIDRQLATLPPGETANVAFLMPVPDAPSISYGLEALQQGQRGRLGGEVWIPGRDGEYQRVTDPAELRFIQRRGLYAPASDGATLEIVQELNGRRDDNLDGAVPLTVNRATKTLHEDIDVDGTTDEASRPPATPVGMAITAERVLRDQHGIPHLGALPASQVVVLGNGGVAGPLVRWVLPEHGMRLPSENHYPNQADLDAGAERLATDKTILLGFTATRRAAHIREIQPDATLIDVGYAFDPSTGKPVGNAHPGLVAQNGTHRRTITAFRGGNGRVTIGVVYSRAAHRKAARTSLYPVLAPVG